jgi:putative SOS response-associated peptidase YedK
VAIDGAAGDGSHNGQVCGRYVSAGSLADLTVLLGVDPLGRDSAGAELEPSFNVAPTDPVPAVLPAEPAEPDAQPGKPHRPDAQAPTGRQLHLLTWGLVPPWADPASAAQRINARVETVLEKPSYRRAIRSRRCLLPADGWYEWTREPGGRRQPWFVRPADGSSLAFAGLFERRHAPDGSVLRSCSILTGPAPAPLAWLHERAPIAVPAELWAAWLDPAADAERLLVELLVAAPVPMTVVPVSPAVNNVRNAGPELIEPIPIPIRSADAESAAGAPATAAARTTSAAPEQATLW